MDELTRQVREAMRLPAPVLQVNPSHGGLTGLETWLWASEFPAPLEGGACVAEAGDPGATVCTLQTVLDGRAVVAEARPFSYEWDTGDAGTRARQSHYVTDSPGSQAEPAVRHMYETTSLDVRPEGVYMISLAVAWQGRYRVTNVPGHPCASWCSLGLLRTVSQRPYRVGYVKSVLIG